MRVSECVATIALQITMAVTHRTAGGPAATTRAAAPGSSGYCGERGGPSGDHARRRPFCSLWTLRREPESVAVVHRHSVRTSLPQPLQRNSQPVTTIALQIRTAGGPAATTRAAAPSGGSGYCGERGGPSGDHARRRPFCSLWTLRREPESVAVVHRHSVRTSLPQPLQGDSQPVTTIALQITMAVTHRTAGGPAATTRAAAPSGGSGYCGERGGAAAPSGGSGYCGERGGPSGDHARRRAFCSLWTLRREPESVME